VPILLGNYIVLIFIAENICNSRSEDKSSTIPNQPAPSKPAQPTAADILGLKRQQISGRQPISLEMEVDQYLSNPNSGTSILNFWKVVLIFHNLYFDFSLICHAGTSTPISSHFPSCNEYNTHSGLKCALWKGLLIWKADNDTSKGMYFNPADGSLTDVEVFNLEG